MLILFSMTRLDSMKIMTTASIFEAKVAVWKGSFWQGI